MHVMSKVSRKWDAVVILVLLGDDYRIIRTPECGNIEKICVISLRLIFLL